MTNGCRNNSVTRKAPASPEERHRLIMEKRIEAYQQLCDVVYEKKGFTSEGIPKSETVEEFGLMDEQARQLLAEFGFEEDKQGNTKL